MHSVFSSEVSHWGPLPMSYIITTACSFAFFWIIQATSEFVSKLFVKSYSQLSFVEQKEFISRIVSNIHAIIMTFAGAYVFFSTNEYVTDLNILHSDQRTGFSSGYFIVDSIAILLYPALGPTDIVIHHIFILSGQFIVTSYQQLAFLGVICSLMEATGPFVNQRWFFDKCGMRQSPLYVVNGICLWLTWFLFRMTISAFLIYLMYERMGMLLQTSWFQIVYFIAQILNIVTLNTIWFLKITNGLLSVLKKRKQN